MHDQICHVPSAACQTPKSTGCCFSLVYGPKSGSPATGHHAPSMTGRSTSDAIDTDQEQQNTIPMETNTTGFPMTSYPFLQLYLALDNKSHRPEQTRLQ